MKRFVRTTVGLTLAGALALGATLLAGGPHAARATTTATSLSWPLRIGAGDDGVVQEITRSDGVLCLVGTSRYGGVTLLCADQGTGGMAPAGGTSSVQ